MNWWQILLLVLGIIAVILVILYFVGRKLQGKADEQQTMINQNKMTTSILVIDKKKQKVKDSNLPKIVQDQIPKYMRMRKLPLVKAKIGPKITTLMCDEKVFKVLPVKKMVKVDLAGMYIVGIKGYKK
ncbi:MAG: hypothetical protein N4A50_02465 [Vallitalea sp.]|jgi:hypothetical protein|nr:hypothetical protein [Vallitalea sp.]